MSDYYEYADRAIKYLNKQFIRIFRKLRAMLPVLKNDELNRLQSVQNAYTEADTLTRKMLLLVGKNAYTAASGRSGDAITEMWLMGLLDEPSPALKYSYINEVDRKRARLVEALIVSTTPNKEIDTALRYWSNMVAQYCIEAVDSATILAFKDIGISKVRWNSQEDMSVCKTCASRDGCVYSINNLPSKTHIGCRCYYTPA